MGALKNLFFLTGQDGLNSVQIEGFITGKELQRGQSFTGYESASTVVGERFFNATSNLLLTNISSNPNQSAVPEPGIKTMLLASLALLLGFSFIRKRMRCIPPCDIFEFSCS